MAMKDDLLFEMLRECDVCIHLAGKLPPGALDWRPTPKQRSTLELMRYISFTGPAFLRSLLDGNWDFIGGGRTTRIVKGDATCLSISAASILAKVTRDRIMRAEAPNYPGFDFEFNKGYPCPRHKAALQWYGPTAIHRRSWVFMEHLPWTGCPRVRPPEAQQSLFPPRGDGA